MEITMMKNYKSIRNFYEAMQQKPRQQEQHGQQSRFRQEEKQDRELSLKKIIDFIKGSKP
jgi:hypothetical protein